MPGQEVPSDEIGAALRYVEVAAVPPEDVRASTHAAMAQAFRDTRAERENVAGAESDESLLIDLTEECVEPNQGNQRRRLALAAAVLVGFVGFAAFGLADRESRTSETATATQVIDRLAEGVEPVELAPGQYSFGHLGTVVEFTSDRPLWIDRADNGILELVVDPSEPGSGRLAIFRTDASLGSIVAVVSDSSQVASNSVIDRIAGFPTNGWAYKVNDDYASAKGCVVDALCVAVVPDEPSQGLAIGPGGFIYRVDQGEHSPMMFVTWAPSAVRNPQAADSNPFESLIDSMVFGAAKPAP